MKLYVAVCLDRHTDEIVRVFSTPEKAIAYCKEFARINARDSEDIQEEQIPGWLYCCSYSTESDSVRVEETTLDPEEGDE